MHSRFFVNLVNLVGWASPTKHLVRVAYFLVDDAHPTPNQVNYDRQYNVDRE
ncbi:MAG: hypothetical protein HUU08_09240 [Candidatus Brocadia sp.]|nr:hypothetical protein [Candidatus Brocadia sp.]